MSSPSEPTEVPIRDESIRLGQLLKLAGVVEARTVDGRMLELSSNCADVFAVDWQSRDNWTVSAQTRDMLRALLVAQ